MADYKVPMKSDANSVHYDKERDARSNIQDDNVYQQAVDTLKKQFGYTDDEVKALRSSEAEKRESKGVDENFCSFDEFVDLKEKKHEGDYKKGKKDKKGKKKDKKGDKEDKDYKDDSDS